jgi:hypothetical protein
MERHDVVEQHPTEPAQGGTVRSEEAESHSKLYDRPPRAGDLYEHKGVVYRVTLAVMRPDGTMDWASTGVQPMLTLPEVTVNVGLGSVSQAVLVGFLAAEALTAFVLLFFWRP